MFTKYRLSLISLFIMLGLSLSASHTHAQITLDGTTGPAGELSGPNYVIDANVGKQAGGNLFHSFGQFNISIGESATFTGPDSVSNIISRVTGGSGSWIDGPLRSEIPGADFFFLNPWGVMFGPNAFLDMGGSFHVSTADYLRLGEDGRFDAVSPEKSVLTTAPPAAFGFLDESPGELKIEGFLEVPPDHEISLTGGNVEIPGGIVSAPGGHIRIFSTASSGEVNLQDFSDSDFPSFKELGEISLSDKAMLDTGGSAAGEIHIRGGKFYLADADTSVSAITNESEGGGIDIHMRESLVVSEGASIFTASLGGKCGDISISADSLFLDKALIFTQSGFVASVGESGANVIGGKGDGGDIHLNAGSTEISGGTISTNTLDTGKSGDISITGESLNIRNGGEIVADNGDIYTREDGNIADGIIIGGKGGSGNVTLNLNRLEMESGSVSSNTLGTATGGNISVTAEDSVSIAGSGTADTEYPSELYYGISTQTRGPGSGGHIRIKTDGLTLDKDAMINTQAYSGGESGNIELNADRVDIRQGGTVTTSTRGAGDAGEILINAGESVSLSGAGVRFDKSRIYTATHSAGSGGKLTIETPLLTVSGDGEIHSKTLGDDTWDGNTLPDGTGGDIELNADRLELTGGGVVTAGSESDGDAGNIAIRVTDTFTAENSSVMTNTEHADGGDMTIDAGSRLILTDSSITTSVKGGKGDGGNIAVGQNSDPEFVIMRKSRMNANAHAGFGGNISIRTDHLITSSNSKITASSELGVDGDIHIESPDEDVSKGLTDMPVTFPDASRWMPTPCAARSAENTSRFILKGRDGLPSSPDDYLSSPRVRTGRAAEKTDIFEKGESSCHNGNFGQAVKVWEQSLNALEAESVARPDLLLCLAYAYQTMGHYKTTRSLLNEALPLAEKQGDDLLNALITGRLGDVHLRLGETEQAEHAVEKSVETARQAGDPLVLASVLNDAGNFHVSDENEEDALSAYQESLELLDSATDKTGLRSKVLLNLIRLKSRSEDETVSPEELESASLQITEQPDSYAKAADIISLSLLVSYLESESSEFETDGEPTDYPSVRILLIQAKKIAESLGDTRMIAYACGYMGQLYEADGRYADALRLTRRAMFFAQDFPEILYRWQWQIARLLRAEGDTDHSAHAYRSAIAVLDPIRPEFFTGYHEKKNRFDTEIKPVYLELTEMLLNPAGASHIAQAPQTGEERLIQARDTMELLKKAELEDFFQDECVTKKKLTPSDRAAPRTAVIYPILLPDSPVILLTLPDGMRQVPVPVSSEKVRKSARRFLNLLASERRMPAHKRTNRSQYYGKELFDWLIRPVETELAEQRTETLIVAPDGILRMIPFSALHDGEDFLVRKYAVIITPAVTLTDTGPTETKNGKTLLCGLSQGVQGYPALPHVKKELEDVRSLTKDAELLINRDFTAENLFPRFSSHDYSAVFMATHGVFGGSPGETFLVTYDGRLNMNQLEELIGLGRYRERPTDLLFLSACQTALGNERAALGLGGIAVRTGVRSAIATLWSVDDKATYQMVTAFCRETETGISKARALQNAQKTLIDGPVYSHPIYWAPFLLIGSGA